MNKATRNCLPDLSMLTSKQSNLPRCQPSSARSCPLSLANVHSDIGTCTGPFFSFLSFFLDCELFLAEPLFIVAKSMGCGFRQTWAQILVQGCLAGDLGVA